MDRTRMLLLPTLLLGALASGCGTEPGAVDPPARAGASAPASPAAAERLDLPPAIDVDSWEWGGKLFHFLGEDGQLDLAPWTACLGSGCYDGWVETPDVPAVGSPDVLYFGFDSPDWRFNWVTFSPADRACGGRQITVRAEPVTDRIFRIDPAGVAGEWRVDVFGRGPGGDAVTSVIWTTRTNGQLSGADATTSLLSNAGGDRHAYEPELHLADLDRTPEQATARLVATDADGRSEAFDLVRDAPGRCDAAGSLSFHGSAADRARAAGLGAAPVSYRVQLRLDGVSYVGHATWPADETDEAPYTRLRFDPPLPTYDGQAE